MRETIERRKKTRYDFTFNHSIGLLDILTSRSFGHSKVTGNETERNWKKRGKTYRRNREFNEGEKKGIEGMRERGNEREEE